MSKTENKFKIAQRIKKARIDAEMTQAEVGNLLGCTYQAISNYERGTSRIEVDILIELCKIYGVSIASILGTEDVSAVQPAADSLSEEERRLVECYRTASPDDRIVVDLTLKKYRTDG